MTQIMRLLIVTMAALALAVTGCGKEEGGGGGGGKGGDGKGAGDGKGGGKGDGKGGGGGKGKGVDLDALAQIKPEGWTIQTTKSGQTISFNGEAEIDGMKVGVLGQAGACELAFLCPAIDVAEFKKNEENLKAMMSNAIKNDPNTVLEIAEAQLAGRKVMTVYSYGFVSDGGSRQSNHALNVFWNDGKNMVTLMLSERSFTEAKTFDEYKASLKREPMMKGAEQLLKAFEGKL